MDYLRPVLDLPSVRNDPRGLAFALTNLGIALVSLHSEPNTAVEMLQNALGIAEDLGDVRAQLAARESLAEALGQAGRADDALATANAQYAEAVRTGYTDQEANAICTIGDLHLAMGNVASARASFEQLMEIARERSDQAIECKALRALARLAVHDGDNASAVRLRREREMDRGARGGGVPDFLA